jgi:hypothetical protein
MACHFQTKIKWGGGEIEAFSQMMLARWAPRQHGSVTSPQRDFNSTNLFIWTREKRAKGKPLRLVELSIPEGFLGE